MSTSSGARFTASEYSPAVRSPPGRGSGSSTDDARLRPRRHVRAVAAQAALRAARRLSAQAVGTVPLVHRRHAVHEPRRDAAGEIGLGDLAAAPHDHTVALRDIAAGEELFEDYTFWSDGGLAPDHWLYGSTRRTAPSTTPSCSPRARRESRPEPAQSTPSSRRTSRDQLVEDDRLREHAGEAGVLRRRRARRRRRWR